MRSWPLRLSRDTMHLAMCRVPMRHGLGRMHSTLGSAVRLHAVGGVRHTPLHLDMQEACRLLSPTASERAVQEECLQKIRTCIKLAFPKKAQADIRAEVFGSSASGTSTWMSDIDLCVLGICGPNPSTGAYDLSGKKRVASCLRKIAKQLRELEGPSEVRKLQLISMARIPIIKVGSRSRAGEERGKIVGREMHLASPICNLAPPLSIPCALPPLQLETMAGVSVDISISDEFPVRAATFMQQQAALFPPMKPLTIVLKVFLTAGGLNNTARGGLSSYSLCNMVIAHLMEEARASRHQQQTWDLGELLYSFLLRYGREFDYRHAAVSVRSGGLVAKRGLGIVADMDAPARLSVDCPISGEGPRLIRPELRRLNKPARGFELKGCTCCPPPGRDVSEGTYQIDSVARAFSQAAQRLESAVLGRSIDDRLTNYLEVRPALSVRRV
jgi:non-canonical poly(A) RNA polymerase PAPD5/7